jgi:hypothetical protein
LEGGQKNGENLLVRGPDRMEKFYWREVKRMEKFDEMEV